VIYTTNAIKSLNYSLRKVLNNRGAFPNDDSILKVFYLALNRVAKRWTRPIRNWATALNQFVILFPDRVPGYLRIHTLLDTLARTSVEYYSAHLHPFAFICGKKENMALLLLVWVAGHSDLAQVVRGSPDLTTNGEVGSWVSLPATRGTMVIRCLVVP